MIRRNWYGVYTEESTRLHTCSPNPCSIPPQGHMILDRQAGQHRHGLGQCFIKITSLWELHMGFYIGAATLSTQKRLIFGYLSHASVALAFLSVAEIAWHIQYLFTKKALRYFFWFVRSNWYALYTDSTFNKILTLDLCQRLFCRQCYCTNSYPLTSFS